MLALESERARCLVVGEDLGTVPEGFRERLDAADVLSYRVLWFERDGTPFRSPARYPVKAAACVSTHDLPTIAGWWNGDDIDEKRALGLLDGEASARRRGERQAEKRELSAALAEAGVAEPASIDPASPHDAAVTAAVHRYACATASALVLVQADDLAGETTALNLPGTASRTAELVPQGGDRRRRALGVTGRRARRHRIPANARPRHILNLLLARDRRTLLRRRSR